MYSSNTNWLEYLGNSTEYKVITDIGDACDVYCTKQIGYDLR